MKRSAAASPAKQDSFAEELDRRVALRTAELTATIEQLRKELSERQRAKEALREEELFNLIVESIPVPVAITSPTGEVEALNKPTLEYFGRTLEELKGWKSSDVVHPDDLQRTVATQIEALQTGSAYHVESRHRRADGTYRWFNVLGLPLRDSQGHILRWFILQIDIDDRKRAEEALRSAERNLRLTINTIPTFISVSQPDGTVLAVNQVALDYHGITLEDVQKEDFRTRYFHPDDAERLREERKEGLNRQLPFEYEVRALGKDGKYRWFLVHCNPLLDDQGRIDRWYSTAFDIEDRKRAEALLAGAKRLLEMVAAGNAPTDVLTELCKFVEETAGDCKCGVYLIDWRTANFRLGAAPSLPSTFNDPVEGLTVTTNAGPCGVAALTKSQVIVTDVESDPRFQSSTIRPLLLAHGLRAHWSTPIYSRGGQVLGTFAIFQDRPSSPTQVQQDLIAQVTHIASIAIERALSETALRQSETFLAEAQRLSRIGSFSWRVTTDVITWSEELYRIYEFDPGTTITLDLIRARVHPEDLTLYEKMVEQAHNGADDFEWQYRLLMPDKSIKHMHAVAQATRDPAGQLEYIAAVRDVTARRLSEEALDKARSELAHVARVMTLGALTASIAHEVNQPLSGIITNASTCVRMLDSDPPNVDGARETAKRTIRDGRRAADVITRLRALFSRKDAATESVDLNEATREVIALSRSELERNRVIPRTQLADELPLVTGDRVQLQQVIINLLRNGSDAMSSVDDRPRELWFRTELEEAGFVRLSVQDTGIGFDPQSLDRLYQTFYTTKDDGMGIGLSVSRSIIENHGGHLSATRNDGPGVTFSFSLPCAAVRPEESSLEH